MGSVWEKGNMTALVFFLFVLLMFGDWFFFFFFFSPPSWVGEGGQRAGCGNTNKHPRRGEFGRVDLGDGFSQLVLL